VSYLLLDRFRALFEGIPYRHRDSSLGDSVAWCLPEDLYALGRSARLRARIDAQRCVLNVQNRTRGIVARRGDGTFGELIPHATPTRVPGFKVARGPIATVEIGTEVKILAKAMIKQIDRVIGDLRKQQVAFCAPGGTPISVGIVGINHSDHYVSFEKDRLWPTDGVEYKHPFQEAEKAEERLTAAVRQHFDEFLLLRFKAWNEPPFRFEWVDEPGTSLDYGAILTRISRKYNTRF
jgi:hypothetical protein